MKEIIKELEWVSVELTEKSITLNSSEFKELIEVIDEQIFQLNKILNNK